MTSLRTGHFYYGKGVVMWCKKKLPLINSAHGSDTRNIINELIKLFNGMGYTYNESLQKAHDVLNEAKQTNDMNKDVQNQLDNLIIESGNANAEVSQARGGLPLLNDRLDESDEKLAQRVRQSTEEKIIYVDPLNGSDESNGTGPFKTIQKAYDSIPTVILHNYAIELAPGVYKEGLSDNPRPAILYADRKVTGTRTERSNNALNASILIRGVKDNPQAVILETTPELTYGVYNVQGQIGLEDITIRAGQDFTTHSLLTSHRGNSYVHANNVTLEGHNRTTLFGAYTESGGQLEFTGQGVIKGCQRAVQPFTAGDSLSIGAWTEIYNCNYGIYANNGSTVVYQSGYSNRIYNCDYAIYANSGANVEMRAVNSSEKITVESPVKLLNGSILNATYVDFLEQIEVEHSFVRFDFSNWQERFILMNSKIMLRGSKSYVTPNTTNATNRPLTLSGSSEWIDEGNNDIKGINGEFIDRGLITYNVPSNGTTLPIYDYHKVLYVSGGSALRTGCTLPTDGITDGKTMHIIGASWGVEIVDGTTAKLVGGKVTLGNSSGQYAGVSLVFYNGKWHEISRSGVNT